MSHFQRIDCPSSSGLVSHFQRIDCPNSNGIRTLPFPIDRWTVRLDVLVLDDRGLHRLDPQQMRDLMKLLDDRYTVRSTNATS